MTASAVGHALSCARLSVPTAVCECRGAVPRLPVGGSRQCAFCGEPPSYQVGPEDRACREHLREVLDLYFRDRWDGWQPATVAPLRSRGGTT